MVIPTYNECENVPRLVEAINAQPGDWNILFVDDNSPDGTGVLAYELSQVNPTVQVINRTAKLGLGPAYIAGMKQALNQGYTVIGQMDADFSHPPELLPQLLDGLSRADISIGSRYITGGSVDRDWPSWRKGLSAFGNWYARTILALPLRDVTGAYRLWHREALMAIPLDRIRSNGYAFLIEMVYMAHRLGFTFHQVPFYFADRRFGLSKMSFRIQREAAIRVLLMRLQYRDQKTLLATSHHQ